MIVRSYLKDDGSVDLPVMPIFSTLVTDRRLELQRMSFLPGKDEKAILLTDLLGYNQLFLEGEPFLIEYFNEGKPIGLSIRGVPVIQGDHCPHGCVVYLHGEEVDYAMNPTKRSAEFVSKLMNVSEVEPA